MAPDVNYIPLFAVLIVVILVALLYVLKRLDRIEIMAATALAAWDDISKAMMALERDYDNSKDEQRKEIQYLISKYNDILRQKQ